jgi:DNA-binding NarL/FixJ family response regulator
VRAWRAALAAFDYGYVYEVARCRWRLAETLIAGYDGVVGDGVAVDEAGDQLRLAHAAAVALGAEPLRDAVSSLARRAKVTGIDDAATGGGRVALSPLTPREQEVLALLAEGYTNRQLGTALFISEKTASVHVSNILGKLDASSRGEAVAIARRRNLV